MEGNHRNLTDNGDHTSSSTPTDSACLPQCFLLGSVEDRGSFVLRSEVERFVGGGGNPL